MKRTSRYGYGRNAYKKPEDRVVGWGKYNGMKMSEVPTDYLEWFVKNAYGHMTARKEYAQQELKRRKDVLDGVHTTTTDELRTGSSS